MLSGQMIAISLKVKPVDILVTAPAQVYDADFASFSSEHFDGQGNGMG